MEQLLSVLRALSATGKPDHLLVLQIEKLPHYFAELSINTAKKNLPLSGTALLDLFWIEKKLPQDEAWINRIAEILARNQERNYINHVLIPQLLALTERTVLAHKILLTCRQIFAGTCNQQTAATFRLVETKCLLQPAIKNNGSY